MEGKKQSNKIIVKSGGTRGVVHQNLGQKGQIKIAMANK